MRFKIGVRFVICNGYESSNKSKHHPEDVMLEVKVQVASGNVGIFTSVNKFKQIKKTQQNQQIIKGEKLAVLGIVQQFRTFSVTFVNKID